jgi:hypothetical protein
MLVSMRLENRISKIAMKPSFSGVPDAAVRRLTEALAKLDALKFAPEGQLRRCSATRLLQPLRPAIPSRLS